MKRLKSMIMGIALVSSLMTIQVKKTEAGIVVGGVGVMASLMGGGQEAEVLLASRS